MREKSDAELLRHFAATRDQAAFAEVVRRHLGLVLGIARRQVGGDAHLAEDVAQRVFTALAGKAAGLAGREVLGGWLFQCARFTAIDVVRAERRRRAREAEAHRMQETDRTPAEPADWETVRPVLDEAVAALAEPERDTLVLRFFEGRAWAEIGDRCHISEAAARMRGERALEKLRRLLSQRGITSTSAALGTVLTQQVTAAPAGLAAGIAANAVGAAVSAAPWVGGGALAFMVSKKLLVTLGGLAAGALGFGLYEYRAAHAAVAAAAETSRAHAALLARVGHLEAELAGARQRALAAEADNSALLAAIAAARGSASASNGPAAELSVASVQARFKAARETAAAGNSADALAEFLWCLDEGMLKVTALSGIRASLLATELAKLAQIYPPAAAALRARRDAAERTVTDPKADRRAVSDFALLNRILGEAEKTQAAFDRLPPGDARRAHLANPDLLSRLVETQRYREVLEVYPYSRMSSVLAASMKLPDVTGHPDPAGGLRRYRESTVLSSARHFEAVVGAGDLKGAALYARQVLMFDDSPATRELLERHAARAGQPGFVATLGR